MRIKGSGTYTGAAGKSCSILGICELADEENLQELRLSGNLSFKKLSCDKVDISGKCEGGSINARSLKISGTCEGDSVSAKNFSAVGKVEVDSLTVEQIFELSGKPRIDYVTADEIIIATSSGFIGEVKCHKIKIFDDTARIDGEFFDKSFIGHFSFNQSRSRVRIKNIEADKIELENCEVDIIRCKDAFIGTNCAVDKLFVSGACKVAADSTVGETICT